MWKFIVLICLLLILSISLSAQASVKEKSQSGLKPKAAKKGNFADSMVSLERSECYGACPIYKVKVFGDGRLIYEGTKYVKIEGKITDKVTSEQFQALMAEFRKARYFTLRNSYEDWKDGCITWRTDASSAITSIRINKRKKSVSHYRGCSSGSNKFNRELQRLSKLEDKIDEIIKIHQWIGTEEERKNIPYLRITN